MEESLVGGRAVPQNPPAPTNSFAGLLGGIIELPYSIVVRYNIV